MPKRIPGAVVRSWEHGRLKAVLILVFFACGLAGTILSTITYVNYKADVVENRLAEARANCETANQAIATSDLKWRRLNTLIVLSDDMTPQQRADTLELKEVIGSPAPKLDCTKPEGE